ALGSFAAGVSSLAHSAIPSTHSNNRTPVNPSENMPNPPDLISASNSVFTPDSDNQTICTFETCDSAPASDVADSIKSTTSTTNTPGQTAEERALAQFLKEKQKLNEKLQKEDARRVEQERKLREKHLRNMEKQERKYRRALEKANEKRQKEEEKRER